MVRPLATALITLLATAGCVAIPGRAAWVEMRPLQVGAERGLSGADRYYPGAVAAIGRRDYAAALELLQLARARAPDDVRVLNAFGVVYDKLGRFDLSARYYAQAAALEPSSPIVAANLAYSATLEQRIARPLEAMQALAPQPRPAPAAPVIELAAAPTQAAPASAPPANASAARPAPPSPTARPPSARSPLTLEANAAPRRLPLLTGNTLLVIDASGRRAGGDAVVARLAHLGWSVPQSGQPGPVQSQTSIVYPARNTAVAHALARTLPYRVHLVNCASQCNRMRLVLGADALAWRKGGKAGSMVRVKTA